ncbi:MAG: hypothetical protein Tsb002_31780 [Wenzhouxiangellaceae bacterium]
MAAFISPSRAILIIVLCLTGVTAWAADPQSEGSPSHYLVQLIRAAPGQLPQLLAQARSERDQSDQGPLLMRHSQGDHWDLMLLRPRSGASLEAPDYSALAHYQLDFIASSPVDWRQLRQRYQVNGLFHIEMFHAAAGKKAELLKQREMENAYYAATEREGNVIFTTVLGSDVDYFTLGFYPDLKAFASDPDLPPERFSQAATDAGFKSRDDIGLYLRQLIIRHHDTLATRVD